MLLISGIGLFAFIFDTAEKINYNGVGELYGIKF